MRTQLPIFSKRLTEITEADLIGLKTKERAEGLFLEYKSDFPRGGVGPSIAAFANTHGGWLLIGVKADKKDNKIVEIQGISSKEGLKEKVKNQVRDTIHPMPPFFASHVVPLEADGECNDRVVVVVKVEESPNPPHICNDGRIYRRSPEGKDPVPATDRSSVDLLYHKGEQARTMLDRLISTRAARANILAAEEKAVQVLVIPMAVTEHFVPDLFSKASIDHKFRLCIPREAGIWDANWGMQQDAFLFGDQKDLLVGMYVDGCVEVWSRLRSVDKWNTGARVMDLREVKGCIEKVLQIAACLYGHVDYWGQSKVVVLLHGMKQARILLDDIAGAVGESVSVDTLRIERSESLVDQEFDASVLVESLLREVKRCFGRRVFEDD